MLCAASGPGPCKTLGSCSESASYIDAHLEAAQPVYPEEYDYLTQTWPELREFLAVTAERTA